MKLSYAQEMMVQKYVGIVLPPGASAPFQVFTTGSPKHYLFCRMDPTGTWQTGVQFPVLKSNLRRGWKRFLTHPPCRTPANPPSWGHTRPRSRPAGYNRGEG